MKLDLFEKTIILCIIFIQRSIGWHMIAAEKGQLEDRSDVNTQGLHHPRGIKGWSQK